MVFISIKFLSILLLLLLYLVIETSVPNILSIIYFCDQLFVLSKPLVLSGARNKILKELLRRCRGCRAEVKVKVKAKKIRPKPAVPANIMGNVCSLTNKTDELMALI